jgi:alkanesulfonate monooxygenase SsuD/methylene tetrahydromethanopterin reductase-like flavin-dependent oxidoreductase (luciferase family)
MVRLAGGQGRLMGDSKRGTIAPIGGEPAEIAAALLAYARLGVTEVQLVVDPITEASIDALAPVLEALRQA